MRQFFQMLRAAASGDTTGIGSAVSSINTSGSGFMFGPMIYEKLALINPTLASSCKPIFMIGDILFVIGLLAAVCALVFGILKQKIEELAANDETVSPEEIKKRKKKNETRFKASLTIAIVLVALPSLLAIIFGAISAN